MRRFLVVAVVGFVASACSLPFGIGQASTSQLINGAADSLSKASGFEIAGKFTTSSTDFTIDIKYQSPSSAHVDLAFSGHTIEALQISSQTYYKGQDAATSFAGSDAFGQAAPKAIGDKWFTTSKATPIDLSGFTDPQKVKANFLNTVTVNRTDNVTVNGQDTAELSDSSSILNITEQSPYELVRVRSKPGVTVSDATNMDLVISNYNKSFGLSAPSGALNLDDPSTFPPFYVVNSVNIGGCNGDPCTVAATVQNKAGTTGASAPSTVTFTATNDADNSTLGTCKATIQPDVANGATKTVSCQITGGAWSQFVQNGGNYTVKAEPDNPTYD